jgi:hypothetical protein
MGVLWWAQQDSNLRLPPCEGGTLPLSYAPRGRELFQGIILVSEPPACLGLAAILPAPIPPHAQGSLAILPDTICLVQNGIL